MSKYRVYKAAGRWWVLNPAGFAVVCRWTWAEAMAEVGPLVRGSWRAETAR